MTSALPHGPAAADLGNPLLAAGPAQFATSYVDTAAGQMLMTTIRTSSATVTVFLDAAEAKEWAANLTEKASGMSSSGLVAATGVLAFPGANGTASGP